MGKKCVAIGQYSIVGGYGNTTNGSTSGTSIIFGKENSSYGGGYIIGNNNGKTHVLGNGFVFGNSNNSYSNDGTRRASGVMIGYDNALSGYYNTMIFGHNNKATSDNASGPEVIVGNYLTPLTGYLKETVLLGQYNNTTSVLTTPVVIIAAGASGSGNRKNAIEIDTSQCKILHDLQLATDNTAVNAIDPPQDPSSPTTNEQTLATLGSIQALKDAINSAHLQRRQVLLTGQITYLDTGTAYNLENTFNITIPSWANRLRLGCQFGSYGETQGYAEFGLIAGKYTYTALNGGSNSFFAANFSFSNKVLTVDKCMRLQDSDDTWDPTTTKFAIISITAYGNFSF